MNFNFRLNDGSLAIDNGANLSSLGINDDFEGNQRPSQNGFDICAYEFGSSSGSSSVIFNTKILLEGGLLTVAVLTSLLEHIPLNQPYGSVPWNYNGNETVSAIPSGVIDWVLIEIAEWYFCFIYCSKKSRLYKK